MASKSTTVAKKRKRVKIKCLLCDRTFNRDFRLEHNRAQHHGIAFVPYSEASEPGPGQMSLTGFVTKQRRISLTEQRERFQSVEIDDASRNQLNSSQQEESETAMEPDGTTEPMAMEGEGSTMNFDPGISVIECLEDTDISQQNLVQGKDDPALSTSRQSDESTSESDGKAHEERKDEVEADETYDNHGIIFSNFDPTKQFPSDPAHFVNVHMSNSLIRQIAEYGPCHPGKDKNADFLFPVDDQNRKFFAEWYWLRQKDGTKIERDWLSYSPSLDKAFCFCCWLFASRSHPNYNDAWSNPNSGFKNWKNGMRGITNHEQSQVHLVAADEYFSFKLRLSKGQTINIQALRIQKTVVFRNRQVLKRIIDQLLFLAKQNLAFRGHIERSGSADESVNEGNFLELCKLLSRYDTVMQDHLQHVQSKEQSTSYSSNTIQNELLQHMAREVRETITDKIRKSGFFGVIIDTTDDQYSISFRYVDMQTMNVEETFVEFVKVVGTSGEELFTKLMQKLKEYGLKQNLLRAFSSDGAANMMGVNKGVRTRIQTEVAENCVVVHCCVHSLNLVLVSACNSCPDVSNFFGTARKLYVVISASEKRKAALRAAQKELKEPNLVLPQLSETRWASHYSSIDHIKKCYASILLVLKQLADDATDNDVESKLLGLRKFMLTFHCILQLFMWHEVLKAIRALSDNLQSSSIDISIANSMVQSTLAELESYRSQEHFNSLKTEATEFAVRVGAACEFEERRVRKIKSFFDEIGRDSPPVTQVQKFKQEIYFYVYDILVTQMQERFTDFTNTVSLFSCLDPHKVNNSKTAKVYGDLCKKYSGDIDEEEAQIELKPFQDLWQRWLQQEEVDHLPTNALELLQRLFDLSLTGRFPNIAMLLKIFAIVPVSSAKAERTFSRYKIIKNSLRKTMGQGRLTNLAMLSIERQLASNVNFDCVIDKFALAKEREMVLLTPDMKADAEARVRNRQTAIQISNDSSTLLQT